jgi:aldehyde dehydrogenase (NAD+)
MRSRRANIITLCSSHKDVDCVSFTGSTRAGVDVAIKAAPTCKRVLQELGGKSANIIMDDSLFASGVLKGIRQAFFNVGQNCNAPTRMLIPVARLEEAEKVIVHKKAAFSLLVLNLVSFSDLPTTCKSKEWPTIKFGAI